MSVVRPYNSIYNTRAILAGVLLVLSALACSVPVRSQAVPTTPTTTVAATQEPTTTPVTTPITTPQSWTASVELPTVRVRALPNGDPTGDYLAAGDQVEILRCTVRWCQISKPVRGWVFRGCLSDNPKKLGCEAE